MKNIPKTALIKHIAPKMFMEPNNPTVVKINGNKYAKRNEREKENASAKARDVSRI